jgi:hypoxanthine phosphoribosyltransferase
MEILIPEYKIERHVRAMAHRLSEEHKNSGNSLPPVMICVLNGGFMFFADLVRDMGIDVEIDFVRPKSYIGQDRSDVVTFTKDIEVSVKGKRVYIVEDIVDTGNTIIEILQRLAGFGATDIKIVTLIQRKDTHMPVDHFCFEVGQEWIKCGYGFDDNGLCRNYRNIYV